MRVLKKSTLREFWEKYPDSKVPLLVWYRETISAKWSSSIEVIDSFSRASALPDNRVVFRIKGNTYRLVVSIDYKFSLVFIRFIGRHDEYDQIDATVI